tara:strand:- start:298 stop:1146 length:849 start_codon:yes stop_codon:yes gene_type:complete
MKKIEPSFGYYYYPDENKVEASSKISEYGLFSTFTLLLAAITIIHRDYKKLPSKFNLKKAMMMFKTDKDEDLYKTLFKIDETVEILNITPTGADSHHEVYSEERITGLYPYIKRYFSLSDEVEDIKEKLKKKYDIVDKDYISIIYRGTDHFTDRGGMMSVNCAAYKQIVKQLITPIPIEDRNVLIQSEEPRVRDFFNDYGAKFINETCIGKVGDLDKPIPKENKDLWIKNYIAAIYIHSQSKNLLTYTGNSGFFATAFRGTTKGVYQETTFKMDKELFFKIN